MPIIFSADAAVCLDVFAFFRYISLWREPKRGFLSDGTYKQVSDGRRRDCFIARTGHTSISGKGAFVSAEARVVVMAKKKPYQYKTVKEFHSIREMLRMAEQEAGDRIAYEFKQADGTDASVTYRVFRENVEALGAALTARGYGSAHIACIGENSYRWIVTYLSVLQSAGVYVPVDKDLSPESILHILTESECRVLFFGAKQQETVLALKEKLPNIRLWVGLDLLADTEDAVSFGTLLEEGRAVGTAAYDALKSDENEMKMLVYTSGTTGIAKGVILTEHNLVSSVYYGLQVSQIYDKGLSVLPYHHTYEAVCDILVGIHFHTDLCINDSLKNVIRNLQFYKPEYIYLVPAFAELFYANIQKNIKKQKKEKLFAYSVKLSNMLLKLGIDLRPKLFGEIRNVFGGNLKKIVCGGAPIRPEIGKFFGDIGISMTGGYGITECSPLVCVNDENCNDYHTVGHKLPCLEWKISEPNEEGIGEITVKGDVVMKGYYKQPEKTAEVLSADGWFRTGDYGYITDDDQLVITGRKKNIIVLSNGKNIYPEELEAMIGRIDAVGEVVVRGIKNEYGEETGLEAEVYPAEEISQEKLESEIHGLLSVLPSYKQIRKVVLRAEPFPKTTSNKIIRN